MTRTLTRTFAAVAGGALAITATIVLAVTNSEASPMAAVQVNPGNITCAKDNSRELTEFWQRCPEGRFYAQIPASDIAGLDARIKTVAGSSTTATPTPSQTVGATVSPVRVVTRTFTVTNDTKTVTVTLPADTWAVKAVGGKTAGVRVATATVAGKTATDADGPAVGVDDVLDEDGYDTAVKFDVDAATLANGESKSLTVRVLTISGS